MEDKRENMHADHRERMKKRFLEHGLDNFNDHNVLELLLFYAQPRKDTNLTAHRLLDAFGGLDGVFEAEPGLLKTVEGVGENAALLIHLVPAVARRYLMAKAQPGLILVDSDAAGEFLKPWFLNCQEERMYVVCLDAKLKVLDCQEIGRGNTVSVNANIRAIVKAALQYNATSVLLAHNHTSGIALPSDEDVNATLRVRQVLRQIGVGLADHIVVTGDEFVSLADSGYLSDK